MAFLNCGGGGPTDLVVYSRRYDNDLSSYTIYDVSNIKEIIIKNVSRTNTPQNRLIKVYLDDVLSYSIPISTSQTIDVSNVTNVKLRTTTLEYAEDITIIFKDFHGNYYEDFKLNMSGTERKYCYGNYYDLSKFTTLILNNKSAQTNVEEKKICVYLDGAYDYNYLITVGDTLTLDVTDNYYMYICPKNAYKEVLGDITLS